MASISRFGRAISSGNSVSDKSFASSGFGILRGLVQSFGKVGGCSAGRHQEQLQIEFGRTIVHGTGFVNSGRAASRAP